MKMIKVLVAVHCGTEKFVGEISLSEEEARSLSISGHVKILPEEKPVVVEEKIEVSEIPLVENEEKPRSKGKKS